MSFFKQWLSLYNSAGLWQANNAVSVPDAGSIGSISKLGTTAGGLCCLEACFCGGSESLARVTPLFRCGVKLSGCFNFGI